MSYYVQGGETMDRVYNFAAGPAAMPEEALRRAVSSVPSLEEIRTGGTGTRPRCDIRSPKRTVAGIPVRLKRLDRYLVTGVISKDEYAAQRARILAEL